MLLNNRLFTVFPGERYVEFRFAMTEEIYVHANMPYVIIMLFLIEHNKLYFYSQVVRKKKDTFNNIVIEKYLIIIIIILRKDAFKRQYFLRAEISYPPC